ncbi:MAG TPA: GDP-mannose 4,6-dehydratase [Ktedonobacterales bacterium]|nr:GDP-mannose 4,6-dehydratase [Ktedonobacterales bacterium]
MAVGEPRRVLITGASGFVGRPLLPLLRDAFSTAELFAQRFDVTDDNQVVAAVRETRPDACIHLAAISTVAQAKQDPDEAWRVNLNGTLHVARALLRHAPDCRLVFASSAEIYGSSFAGGQTLDEGAVLAPMNSYAASKAAADLALGAMAAEGLRSIRLRLFNHTGPGQSEAFVVPAFARQIVLIQSGRQAPPLRVGELAASRDFLDVCDVCHAYVACLLHGHELAPDTIINIASGMPRRIGDILQALLDLAGLRTEVLPDPARMRRSQIPSAIGDNSRARQLLGWSPRVPWQHTLINVLADWRSRLGD